MRIIDADNLIPMIKYATTDSEIGVFPIKIGFDAIKKVIDEMPTIEAEIVRHGKWIGKPIGGYSDVKCSACGHVFLENNGKWEYCPNCGARMDGEGAET